MIIPDRRITIFAGHYGAGKTNIAVNYALYLRRQGKPVMIADLDIVNPYFRTKDSAQELEEAGIGLIASPFANSNVDLPAIPPEAYRLIQDRSVHAVIDVGGDDRGAYALGRFAPYILEENDYNMAYVVNQCRLLTESPEDCVEIMKEIEAAGGIPFTSIINNTNLSNETEPELLWESVSYVEKLQELTGLPCWFTSVREDLADRLSGFPTELFQLKLQKKYWEDELWQK